MVKVIWMIYILQVQGLYASGSQQEKLNPTFIAHSIVLDILKTDQQSD